MRYFPISIDTHDKNILILGGGELATSKIKILLDTEFKIYCISDNFTEEIIQLQKDHSEKLLLKGRTITEDFLFFGYDYVVIATEDAKLNDILAEKASRSNTLYYRADHIGESEFLFNDVISHFGLAVSMLSEGLSDTVKSRIMKDIENVLFKYDVEKTMLLDKIRTLLILKNYPDVDGEIEKLSKKNVAMIKSYLETLDRSHPDVVQEFKESKDISEENKNNEEIEKVTEETIE